MHKCCHSVPMKIFEEWHGEMLETGGIREPSAMVLTTCENNRPSARVVLLKGYSEAGFEFFTNFQSRKGRELQNNPFVSLVFDWRTVNRQVRVEGIAGLMTPAESDKYHASRSRDSQISAWCSKQSMVLESREKLLEEFEIAKKKFEGKEVPRPEHWGGVRVVPYVVEFWQNCEHRLHDRKRYRKDENNVWVYEILYP